MLPHEIHFLGWTDFFFFFLFLEQEIHNVSRHVVKCKDRALHEIQFWMNGNQQRQWQLFYICAVKFKYNILGLVWFYSYWRQAWFAIVSESNSLLQITMGNHVENLFGVYGTTEQCRDKDRKHFNSFHSGQSR